MTQYQVPPEGPLTARIAFVGEAGGETERIKHRPFVGSAGKELDNWFDGGGIARSEVYITNVVKEQPVKNKLSTFVNLSPSKKKPISAAPRYKEWLRYVDELHEELLSLPNLTVVVPLGEAALYTLTAKLKPTITQLRGSLLTWKGKKLIPMLHPSNYQRGDWTCRPISKHDMRRVREESLTAKLTLPSRNIEIVTDFTQAVHYLKTLHVDTLIAFDIEAINDEVSHISFSPSSLAAISIPFLKPWENVWSEQEESELWYRIAGLLQTNPCVAQNGAYDAYFLYRRYGIRVNLVDDTNVGQAIALPDLPKDLGFLCSIYSREPYYKDEGTKAIRGRAGTWDEKQFAEYNAKDSAVLHDILPKIKQEVRATQNEETYRETIRLIRPILAMQAKGILVDETVRARLSAEYKEKESEALEQINSIVGYELNPNSDDQVKEYFYKEKKYKPYKKKGKDSVDKDALARLTAKGDPVAPLILQARQANKARSTFLDLLLPDGRLRSSVSPTGAVSGRLSSSKFLWGEGANQQNMPKLIREMWIPDHGYCGFGIDLIMADNTCVANFAREDEQLRVLAEGGDLHQLTADKLTEMIGTEITRKQGKAANHGLNYDMGWAKAALEWKCTAREAKTLVSGYHSIYPGVRRKFHGDVKRSLANNRTLCNPFGRHRRFMAPLNHDTYKEGYNWMAQSTVADCINRRGLNYIYYNPETFREVELLNQIHDEIVFQLPVSIGWTRIATTILRIRDSLSATLVWQGRPFFIPAELKVHTVNFKEGEELRLQSFNEMQLAVKLAELWRRAHV